MTENIETDSVLRERGHKPKKFPLIFVFLPIISLGLRRSCKSSVPKTGVHARSDQALLSKPKQGSGVPWSTTVKKVSTSSSSTLGEQALPHSSQQLYLPLSLFHHHNSRLCLRRDALGCAGAWQGSKERLWEGWESSTRQMPAGKEGFPRC